MIVSDGTPLDAATIAANFRSFGLRKPDQNLHPTEVANNCGLSETINPLTVKFTIKAPSPGFLQGTVIGPCLVVPATLARKFDEPGDPALVIDSGAFRAVSAPPTAARSS